MDLLGYRHYIWRWICSVTDITLQPTTLRASPADGHASPRERWTSGSLLCQQHLGSLPRLLAGFVAPLRFSACFWYWEASLFTSKSVAFMRRACSLATASCSLSSSVSRTTKNCFAISLLSSGHPSHSLPLQRRQNHKAFGPNFQTSDAALSVSSIRYTVAANLPDSVLSISSQKS